LLLAHPAGGTTGVYKTLAGLLGGGRPVFGLERLEGPVPERATRYAELIAERFGGSGWVLGGWSFGGVLAYEIARQLAEAGHPTALLVLLDAALPLPAGPGGEGESLAHRFAAFAGYLRNTYGLAVQITAGELAGLTEDEQLSLLTERMVAAGIENVLSPAILRHQRQSHLDTRALERYEPGKYDGPVVLYRTDQETPWAVTDPRYQITSEGRGWDKLCPNLTIAGVDAHHLNLLDPPAVESVAAHLRTLLQQGGHP
jgi:thioesterase domain-containing protein